MINLCVNPLKNTRECVKTKKFLCDCVIVDPPGPGRASYTIRARQQQQQQQQQRQQHQHRMQNHDNNNSNNNNTEGKTSNNNNSNTATTTTQNGRSRQQQKQTHITTTTYCSLLCCVFLPPISIVCSQPWKILVPLYNTYPYLWYNTTGWFCFNKRI